MFAITYSRKLESDDLYWGKGAELGPGLDGHIGDMKCGRNRQNNAV